MDWIQATAALWLTIRYKTDRNASGQVRAEYLPTVKSRPSASRREQLSTTPLTYTEQNCSPAAAVSRDHPPGLRIAFAIYFSLICNHLRDAEIGFPTPFASFSSGGRPASLH